MRVAVVHNAVTDDSAPDERDVLVQTESVVDALATCRMRLSLFPVH